VSGNDVTVLLAVIALSAIVQAVLLAALAVGGKRIARRVQDLQARMEDELQPAVESLARITRSVAEVTDLAVLQARRVEGAVAGTLERIDEARGHLRRALRRPVGMMGDVAAVLRALRRGLDVYGQLGGLKAQSRGKTRRYRDDEHLFI
jgi:phage host-nuclease inhibitor protein Gam